MGFYQTTTLFAALFYSICGVFTSTINGEDTVGRFIVGLILFLSYLLSKKISFLGNHVDKICAILFPIVLMHYSGICLEINKVNPQLNTMYLLGYVVISAGLFQSFTSGKTQFFVATSFVIISYFVWTNIPLMNIWYFLMNYVILLLCSFVLSLKLKDANNKIKEGVESIEKVKRETITKSIANSLSHEINNPLTIIIGTATILKVKYKDSIDQKYVENLENSISRIKRVMSVIKTCVPDEKQIEERFDLSVEVQTYMALYQEKFKKLKINYVFSTDGNENICLIKKSDLYSILGNLIDNAVFFSCKEEFGRYIDIRVSSSNDSVVFDIENSSKIDKKIYSKLFEPFVTSKEIHEGSGLGLFAVKNLLKQYDGRIEIRSKENENANFIFYLPLKKDL